MPYRFQIEVTLPQQRVMERIRSLVGEELSIRQWFSELRKPRDRNLPPFIGSSDEDSFTMHPRHQGGKPRFLPRIRGNVLPTPTGTQINVTMSMPPADVVFMTFWLGMSGVFIAVGLITIATAGLGQGYEVTLVGTAFFLLGVAFTHGGFYWEALKAKRILTDAFADSKIAPPTSRSQAP